MIRFPHIAHRGRPRDRGFSVLSALFLLVVLAGLGASMLTFFTTQQTTSAQDLLGSRAYQAARAGIEWGLYQVRIVKGGTGCPDSPTSPTSSTRLPALAADLAQFSVVVTCDPTSFTEAGADGKVFLITATATSGTVGTPGYVERRLEVRI
jgi:MSHA biogenesis protein MshP